MSANVQAPSNVRPLTNTVLICIYIHIYSVSNHQPHDNLLIRLFRRRSKKTSKLLVTGLCAGNSPGTGEFPAQMASNVENVSIWWRHHVLSKFLWLSAILFSMFGSDGQNGHQNLVISPGTSIIQIWAHLDSRIGPDVVFSTQYCVVWVWTRDSGQCHHTAPSCKEEKYIYKKIANFMFCFIRPLSLQWRHMNVMASQTCGNSTVCYQQCFHACNKEYINGPHHWQFVGGMGGIHRWLVDSLTKGP